MSKTLVISYPNCIMFEVMLACELIGKTHTIELASVDGDDFRSTTGLTFKARHSYENARAEEYECILVPGGDTYDVFENAALSELLQSANASNTLIGAICAGPLLLAKSGILKGRRFTHGFGDHYQEFLAPHWQGAEFIDEAVVADGNLVTAKPEAHIDFAVKLARLCNAITDDDRAEYYRAFYRGRRLPQPAEQSPAPAS